MPRIRTLKPEFFADEKFAPLPVIDRFVFIGLICMADDCGRVLDNERVINAFLFPETDDSARESLATLSRMGRIRRGKTASGQRVVQIVNWARHQRVDKPQLKMALPEIVVEKEDTSVREPFANDSGAARETFAPHTNDQRPTIYDQRPIPSSPDEGRDAHHSVSLDLVDDEPTALAAVGADAVTAGDGAVAASPRPRRSRQATTPPAAPKPVASTASYRHFPHEVRAELMAVWRDEVMPLREDQKGRFVKAFAGWFQQPESERAENLPRDAEVVTALREMLVARRFGIGGDRLNSPEIASERIGLVVQVLRDTTNDPIEQIDRIDRVLSIRAPGRYAGKA